MSVNPNLYQFTDSGVSDTTGDQLTCLRMFQNVNEFTGQLQWAQGNQDIDYKNLEIPNSELTQNIGTIEISWIKKNDSGGSDRLPKADPNLLASLPPSDQWHGNGPNGVQAVAMELTIVNYPVLPPPNPPNVDNSQIRIRNALFLPTNQAFGTQSSDGPDIYSGAKFKGNCGPTVDRDYYCMATIKAKCTAVDANNKCIGVDINSNPNDVFIVQLRGRYLDESESNISYRLRFYDPSGSLINVPDGDIHVDAIAKSGNFYRRIEAVIPKGSGGVPGRLNYVLFGDMDICKQFSIYQNGGGYAFNNRVCPNP